MQKVYKDLSNLKHDGQLYEKGTIIQDIEGLEHLVEQGILKIIDGAESAEESTTEDKTETTAETTPENTWGPTDTVPSDGDEQPEKTHSIPVVGSGDVDPDEGEQVDPDTGANLG